VTLRSGSHAMEICESCQVGNKAALSRTFCVSWGYPDWVGCKGNV